MIQTRMHTLMMHECVRTTLRIPDQPPVQNGSDYFQQINQCI